MHLYHQSGRCDGPAHTTAQMAAACGQGRCCWAQDCCRSRTVTASAQPLNPSSCTFQQSGLIPVLLPAEDDPARVEGQDPPQHSPGPSQAAQVQSGTPAQQDEGAPSASPQDSSDLNLHMAVSGALHGYVQHGRAPVGPRRESSGGGLGLLLDEPPPRRLRASYSRASGSETGSQLPSRRTTHQ